MATLYHIRIAVPDQATPRSEAAVLASVQSNLGNLGFFQAGGAVCESVHAQSFTSDPAIFDQDVRF
jgi:hypothetical protein